MKTIVFSILLMISVTPGLVARQAPDEETPGMGSGQAPSPARRFLTNPASLNEQAPEVYAVKFVTTQGAFVIQAHRAWAPRGADRFYNLAKNGFYDGASFFRVLSGFVVQFGISPDPQISKVWKSATIPDDPVVESNLQGTITFATAGPNTRTTQVFINLADNHRLDGMGFSPFGKIAEGMDVVQRLYSGYGEGRPRGNGPDQGRIEAEGKAYLESDFPKLDSIRTATISTPPVPKSSKSKSSRKTKEKP
jgi:peptidyl-prolyl cis-trans isomerase A (cyclophilin A)